MRGQRLEEDSGDSRGLHGGAGVAIGSRVAHPGGRGSLRTPDETRCDTGKWPWQILAFQDEGREAARPRGGPTTVRADSAYVLPVGTCPLNGHTF